MKNVFVFIAVLVASIAGLSSCDDDTVLRDVVKEVTILVSEKTDISYQLFDDNKENPIECMLIMEGRFGFGMKRFLFKIGKNFVVESQFEQDAFKVEVDVDRWSKKVRTIINEDGTSDLSVLSVLSTPLKSLILKRRWKTSSLHSNLLLNHSSSTILQIFKTYGL